ncbi:MAG: lipolytic protein G-D-S-L family [Calothrix sp. FI2-JRJ7]|jgi:lysophospholipase L1-like esterase|nr:lipolytic protein G-D-S-L family [Calothrix sp. FI2-JRJ7]
MKDVYLLAAGVLTGLAVPTSALPQLSIAQQHAPLPVDISVGSQLQQSHATQNQLPPLATPENSVPEFSNPVSNPVAPSRITQPSATRPLSGSQLYYQRLAALRLGRIYTRLASVRSTQEPDGRKSQLSYEDWKGLLALEARAMSDGQGDNRLSVLVGDSLSMWFPKDKLPSGKLWLNQGISGDTSAGVLKRISAFSKTRPDVIYVMAGINDLRRGATDETILKNYRRIIRRLREEHPMTQIIVQSILPTRLPTIPNTRIRNINQKLSTIAKEEGANYLNIHHWFTDFQGNLRQELTTDGLHLSLNGYEVWQAAIQQIETKNTLTKAKRLKKV